MTLPTSSDVSTFYSTRQAAIEAVDAYDAPREAFDAIADPVPDHASEGGNAHHLTKAQLDLTYVNNYPRATLHGIDTGANNQYALLEDGRTIVARGLQGHYGVKAHQVVPVVYENGQAITLTVDSPDSQVLVATDSTQLSFTPSSHMKTFTLRLVNIGAGSFTLTSPIYQQATDNTVTRVIQKVFVGTNRYHDLRVAVYPDGMLWVRLLGNGYLNERTLGLSGLDEVNFGQLAPAIGSVQTGYVRSLSGLSIDGVGLSHGDFLTACEMAGIGIDQHTETPWHLVWYGNRLFAFPQYPIKHSVSYNTLLSKGLVGERIVTLSSVAGSELYGRVGLFSGITDRGAIILGNDPSETHYSLWNEVIARCLSVKPASYGNRSDWLALSNAEMGFGVEVGGFNWCQELFGLDTDKALVRGNNTVSRTPMTPQYLNRTVATSLVGWRPLIEILL